MITRAIVEEVITPYQVKVRIPLLDRYEQNSSMFTKNNYLNQAVICTTPRCEVNLLPGDVVFVGFEDGQNDEVVILGVLYKETLTKDFPNQTLRDLTVIGTAKLPNSTDIGLVTSNEIQSLSGCNINIKKELDLIKARISDIEKTIKEKN